MGIKKAGIFPLFLVAELCRGIGSALNFFDCFFKPF